MTLKQLFRDYALEKTIGKVILRDALQRELEGYQAAEWVVCHSQWAAESVMREYAIPAAKIRTIVPGANIDFVVFQHWYNTASMHLRQPHEPLRLLFIGKYWDRKGLDRLLETLLILQQKTRQVKLQVMGCDRNTLPVHLQNLPDVEWLGFVNKRTDTERFLQITGNADVGCLLSRAEAGGMVLREYHALGLIVMGPDVGGAPEHLFSDAGKAFPPESSAEEIANWIYTLATDYELYRKLRVRAWEKRQRATWETSVKQWREILPRNR
ncbi:MAG TPA: glycosyltransferase family 4 protein [Gemmatales bacterium]|nr:glycosyltransferase family 4 protein [Gemmatales bacterium]